MSQTLFEYCEPRLRAGAAVLNGIITPNPDAELSYCLLAAAVHWSDEAPIELVGVHVIHGLRPVFHHRTRMMLGEDSGHRDIWRFAQTLFPAWIGFAPERCNPPPYVMEQVRAELARGAREIRKLDRLSRLWDRRCDKGSLP